jgi:hypothetical protein
MFYRVMVGDRLIVETDVRDDAEAVRDIWNEGWELDPSIPRATLIDNRFPLSPEHRKRFSFARRVMYPNPH